MEFLFQIVLLLYSCATSNGNLWICKCLNSKEPVCKIAMDFYELIFVSWICVSVCFMCVFLSACTNIQNTVMMHRHLLMLQGEKREDKEKRRTSIYKALLLCAKSSPKTSPRWRAKRHVQGKNYLRKMCKTRVTSFPCR